MYIKVNYNKSRQISRDRSILSFWHLAFVSCGTVPHKILQLSSYTIFSALLFINFRCVCVYVLLYRLRCILLDGRAVCFFFLLSGWAILILVQVTRFSHNLFHLKSSSIVKNTRGRIRTHHNHIIIIIILLGPWLSGNTHIFSEVINIT